MKNIIFIAPPAAGKGTQSSYLVKKYGYVHVSTGDMLREAIASGSELGNRVKNIIDQGLLVSDDIMIDLIKDKLTSIKGKPFILDGFPRTLNQAKALNEMFLNLNIDNYVAIYLEITKKLAMERSLGRVTCEKCGTGFNKYSVEKMPKKEGICDKCGGNLISRTDDNEESFNKRFDTFIKNNESIIEFYKDLNRLEIISANCTSIPTFEGIVKVIND